MKRFRKEKYIKQRYSSLTRKYSFQVSFEYYDLEGNPSTYTKSYNEKDYTTPGEALDAACKHRDKMRHKLNTEGLAKRKSYTVEDVYIMTKELYKLRLETYRKLDLTFYKYILPTVKNKEINKVKAIDIYKSLNNMVSDCSDDTIKRTFTIWKKIFKTARVNRLVSIDVTDEVIVPKSEVIKKKKDVETNQATLEAVIDSLRNRTKQTDKYIFNTEMMIYGLKIMYYTGIRPAECFALRRSDINLINNTISIEIELGSSYTEYNVIRNTKTLTSVRTIPIVKELKEILIELSENQNHDTYLLATFDGELFDIDTITTKINYVCKKDNLKFNMYRLRHQFSTDLITANKDPRTIMELMGHNNIAMTIEYARSSDELKEKALKDRKLS